MQQKVKPLRVLAAGLSLCLALAGLMAADSPAWAVEPVAKKAWLEKASTLAASSFGQSVPGLTFAAAGKACKLTLTGRTQVPSQLTHGTSVPVTGTIKAANCRITKVTAKITSPGGSKTYYSRSIVLKSKSFSLKPWDNRLNFSWLSPGAYKFTVTAKSSRGKTKTLQSVAFVVQPPAVVADPVAALQAAIAALEGPGYQVGLAAAAMGESASLSAGSWSGGEAWSTIKVPLAVAAVRAKATPSRGNGKDKFPYGACTKKLTRAKAIEVAIRDSDNCAAWQLWEGLGGDAITTAAAVDKVLLSGGDNATAVVSFGNGKRLTSGLTIWQLTDQATFASHLPVMTGASQVWLEMGRIRGTSAVSGLSKFARAHTKIGVGAAAPGGPVTRQFGIIPVGNGLCSAVAIGTNRRSSDYEMMTKIAQAIRANLAALPAGPCPAGIYG